MLTSWGINVAVFFYAHLDSTDDCFCCLSGWFVSLMPRQKSFWDHVATSFAPDGTKFSDASAMRSLSCGSFWVPSLASLSATSLPSLVLRGSRIANTVAAHGFGGAALLQPYKPDPRAHHNSLQPSNVAVFYPRRLAPSLFISLSHTPRTTRLPPCSTNLGKSRRSLNWDYVREERDGN